MKILQVCNHFYPCVGGIERYVEDLCRNLIKLGHESDVLCLNACAHSKKKLPAFEKYNGIKIVRVNFLDLWVYKVAPSTLRHIFGYDVIHVHGLGFFSDFLGLTKFIHKKPLVLSTHGGIFHTPSLSFLKQVYFDIWSKFLLKKFKVIAVSRHDARIFSRITDVQIVSNAIEVKDFDLPRHPENNTFLFLGRISKNKRVDNLIKALSVLNKNLPVKLYVIGEDWEGLEGDLKKLAEAEGLNAIFTGKLAKDEVATYLSKAMFFVSSSEYEGFGIAVIEAMAAALVPILNDIEAFRDLVNDGENGFIVDFSNPQAASDSILKILSGDLEKISRSAKESVGQYDWKNVVKQVDEIYGSLV